MGEETQAEPTPTPSDNIINKIETGAERESRGGRHINAKRTKTKSGTPNTFKGSVQEVGAVLGTKDESFNAIFQNL